MTNVQSDMQQQSGTGSSAIAMTPNIAVSLPKHLQAPAGVDQQVYEINLTIAVLLLEAAAARRWLEQKHPDTQAVSRTSARILLHAAHLDELVNKL
jgi:hypothetical protein